MTADKTELVQVSEPPTGAAKGSLGSHPTPAFFRLPDVLRITALSRPTLYRRIAARKFPPPIHLGGRACGWSAVALQTWVEDPNNYIAPTPHESDPPQEQRHPLKYAHQVDRCKRQDHLGP